MTDANDPRFAAPWQGRVRQPPGFLSATRLQRIAGNRGTQRILGIGEGLAAAPEPPTESLAVKLVSRWKKLLGR